MKSGIYKITNTKNGKVYIGAASTLRKRKTQHFAALNKNEHHNNVLQNSFNKYGKEAFIFEVIEFCSPSELKQREQFYIDKYLSYDRRKGYNLSPAAFSCLGIKRSKETREKLAASKQGLRHPKADRKLHTFAHKEYGVVQMTQIDFYTKFNLGRSNVSSLVTGALQSLGGWRLNKIQNNKSRKLSDEDLENMKKDYASGLTIKEVAKKHRVSRNTAYERLKEAGLKNRSLSDAFKLKSRSGLNCEQLISEYESGISIEKLMAKYSMSNTSIRNIFKDYGVRTRTPAETHRMVKMLKSS